MDTNKLAEMIFMQLKPNNNNSITEDLNEFSRGEVGVLGYLAFDKNEVTAGELSDKLGVSTARIASILNSLENKEYIVRKVDNIDKRKIMVLITDKGMNLAINTKKKIINKIIKIINEIGYDDIEKYINITLRIRNILDNQC